MNGQCAPATETWGSAGYGNGESGEVQECRRGLEVRYPQEGEEGGRRRRSRFIGQELQSYQT
jgi:hypothetical protein